jgi:adenylate cyclase
MNRILVVDDEPDLELLIKQKFRQQIREKKYEFLFTENGQKALDIISVDKNVDMVLSDINMPVLDGLTFLTKVVEFNPLVKTVILSAYGDLGNIRTAMNRGAFDFLTKPIDFTDLELTLAKTLEHVQTIRQTINAIRENDILRMYVDHNVLNFMSNKEFENTIQASEIINATVVFIDICGFTAISEKLAPNKVVELINSYFDVMVDCIASQNGTIDKFMGDCVMAIFKGDYHLDRAIEACLSVRIAIENIKLPLLENATLPNVSIGIKSGEMVSGNIGSVTLRRLDYTVIGDTVNTAQRLQSIANAGQIVIEESDYHAIKESFNCQYLETLKVKNKEQPLVIYEVIA